MPVEARSRYICQSYKNHGDHSSTLVRPKEGERLCRCELSKVLYAACPARLTSCDETRQQHYPYVYVRWHFFASSPDSRKRSWVLGDRLVAVAPQFCLVNPP
jgi:hypothetical protein